MSKRLPQLGLMKPRSSEQQVEGCLDIEHVELCHETKWTHLKFKAQLDSPLGVLVGSYRRRRRSEERFLQSDSMEGRERTQVESSSGRLRDRVIFEEDVDVESFDVGPIPFGASASVKVRALIEAICSTAPCNSSGVNVSGTWASFRKLKNDSLCLVGRSLQQL